MKRFFIIFTFLLAAVIGASAQSLSGTWVARIMESESDQSEKVSTDLKMTGRDKINFSESTFTRIVSCTVTIKASSRDTSLVFTIKVNGSASGTWKREGENLTLTPDKKAKPSLSVESKDCPALVKALIIGPLKSELKEALKEVDEMKIISYDENTFTVIDDGEKVTYNKAK